MAAQDIIVRPILTEKCMAGIGNKKYVFEVAPDATKIDIARACEELFGVKVSKVTTLHVRPSPPPGQNPGLYPFLEKGYRYPEAGQQGNRIL
jgi:large subunit ribosomal protein L23